MFEFSVQNIITITKYYTPKYCEMSKYSGLSSLFLFNYHLNGSIFSTCIFFSFYYFSISVLFVLFLLPIPVNLIKLSLSCVINKVGLKQPSVSAVSHIVPGKTF